jgi:predicted nucleic acid-binding Zn ribbon protein
MEWEVIELIEPRICMMCAGPMEPGQKTYCSWACSQEAVRVGRHRGRKPAEKEEESASAD